MMQAALWWTAGTAAAVSLGASLAERRRARRRDLDRVGWMPWAGLAVTALFVAVLAAGYAISG